MTGYATGPHLDYRVKKGNTFVNPRKISLPPAQPVTNANMASFIDLRDRHLARLSSVRVGDGRGERRLRRGVRPTARRAAAPRRILLFRLPLDNDGEKGNPRACVLRLVLELRSRAPRRDVRGHGVLLQSEHPSRDGIRAPPRRDAVACATGSGCRSSRETVRETRWWKEIVPLPGSSREERALLDLLPVQARGDGAKGRGARASRFSRRPSP